MTDIGFIGLGIMGRPMAGHLQAAGHRLFVLEKSAAAKDLVAAGATACKSSKEIAEKASVVIVMVPDTPQVDDVLFRADGIAAGVGKGKVVIDMSTGTPRIAYRQDLTAAGWSLGVEARQTSRIAKNN
mgnify:CR=1 FL=1